MLVGVSIAIGFRELLTNKLRSFLSVLGIIIGIIALIVMMAVMTGIERQWLRYIEERGGLKLGKVASINPIVDGRSRPELKRDLTLEDAEIIKREDRLIRYVSPEIHIKVPVNYKRRQYFAKVIAGLRDTLTIDKQKIAKGRPITHEDVRLVKYVCVIGSGMRDKLFGANVNPVGEFIEFSGISFQVVGLLKENKLMRNGRNVLKIKNYPIYIPLTVIQHEINTQETISQIRYIVRRQKDISRAQKKIGLLIDQRHRLVGDTKITTQEESYLETKKSFSSMKLGFSLIAGISLLVGGIGIMNIMFATIAQRVKEIGIRKSVGARSSDIMVQFLVESVIVSSLGGFLGVLGSFIIVGGARYLMPQSYPVIGMDAIFFATTFSILIGVFFGITPAVKAAKLDPIEALRYQ